MNGNKITFAASTAAIAALAACSNAAPTVEPATNTPAASTPVAPAPVTPTTAAATPTPTDRSAKFGDTVTFGDGTKVKVTSGGFVPAGQHASGAVEGRIALINIAVTAGTKEIDAMSIGAPRVTVGAGGKTARSAVDLTNDIGGDFLSTILPGETQTARVGYGIAAVDAKNVRVEVRGPDYEDRPAIFKGAIG